jgi:beta-phosphoglucomutase
MLNLVVFDFDGVIADSEPSHFEMLRQTLEEEAVVLNWRDYCERYLGYDDQECIRHILLDFGRDAAPALVSRLVGHKSEKFAQYIKDHCVILPGVPELLTDLQTQRVTCAICSGALRSEIEFVLNQAGLGHFFDVIVAAQDVTASKPDPEGYLLSLSRVNARRDGQPPIRVDECVVIEDSMWGIQAAKAAQMPCLAVANSYPPDALGQADAVVPNLTEVSAATLRQLVG